MLFSSLLDFLLHSSLAILLFFAVNWIGSHAVDFGYSSTTLFEQPNESVALNFFIRALSPAVFIIIVSSIFVSFGRPEFRIGILAVAPYYYMFRAGVIFLLNRQRLVSWPRYIGHAVVGMGAAYVAYHHLIIPNKSLIPDLETAGNELWLAIFAFLYAVANKIPLSGGPGSRRRNAFIKIHYGRARQLYGQLIDTKINDDLLKLISYSIIIYEDYCRPPAIRLLERLAWWKETRTTGIMQVMDERAMSDRESVIRGLDILLVSWNDFSDKESWHQVRSTISKYNKDDDYINKVLEVMEILAVRVDDDFRVAYERIWS